MVSNSPGKNVVRLRRAGFSDWIILGIAEFNTVGSQLLGYVITVGLCGDPRFYTMSYAWRRLDVWLLCVVFVNLALAEAAFTIGHYLLHSRKSLLSLHVMHHCCVHASWTTNVLFHPIDLAIEFSGPAISLLLMHFIVWRDPFVLMVTFVIFQIWYALDHDESLKTYHYAHHTHNNSLYAIYINVKGKPRSNLLRDYMRKIVEKDEYALHRAMNKWWLPPPMVADCHDITWLLKAAEHLR
eukprot:CAMPEP_0172308042 /NCGR_PEP_ID=MMETSP1058-20130122/8760_1 /TAXON_ID=83371 /ORGANISM="Detonula confervacea, Strain CCMP 353" /LENGTH=239 /DNA_ID=CAMNT_0013020375 /DNA_START=177 /DNA_END=897 /DNA_ORIENTATION=+